MAGGAERKVVSPEEGSIAAGVIAGVGILLILSCICLYYRYLIARRNRIQRNRTERNRNRAAVAPAPALAAPQPAHLMENPDLAAEDDRATVANTPRNDEDADGNVHSASQIGNSMYSSTSGGDERPLPFMNATRVGAGGPSGIILPIPVLPPTSVNYISPRAPASGPDDPDLSV